MAQDAPKTHKLHLNRPRHDPKIDLTQTEKAVQNQPETQEWPKTGPRHLTTGPGQPKAETGQAKGPG